jgi:chemotaxis protein CheD
MMQYKLNIGDVVSSSLEATYTCFGLGSCIGLFLQDRITGLAGGAHILLPEKEKGPTCKNKFYNVEGALNELLYQFREKGSNLTSLRAKVTGGASVISVNTQTGFLNAESVARSLVNRKIYIAAIDVGGYFCRTARFESETGLLTVKIPLTNEYKTY